MIILQGFLYKFLIVRRSTVARECTICGKGRRSGNNVSHANNRTKRVFRPNLQRVRVIINSASKYIMACTRCLRSNRIQKAV